jgi:hypothetical protein
LKIFLYIFSSGSSNYSFFLYCIKKANSFLLSYNYTKEFVVVFPSLMYFSQIHPLYYFYIFSYIFTFFLTFLTSFTNIHLSSFFYLWNSLSWLYMPLHLVLQLPAKSSIIKLLFHYQYRNSCSKKSSITFLCGAGDKTQGLAHAREVLYSLSYIPCPPMTFKLRNE